jgi:hypothetical protein
MLLGACAALLTSALQARDIYVNNLGGDDRNDGTMAGSEDVRRGPVRTLAFALKIADAGDRIVLAKSKEPYRESVTLQAGKNSGLSSVPFVIEGNGAILDGSAAVPPGAWQFVRDGVFKFQPRRLHYQVLYRDGIPLEQRPVSSNDEKMPDLKPLEWCMWRQAVHFCVEPDKIPNSYNLSYAVQPVGITLYEVRNVVIRDLTVQGFQLDGVNAHDGATDCTLAGITSRGNGRSGISVGGASRVELRGCVLGNNGVAQLRVEGRAIVRTAETQLLETGEKPFELDGGRLWIDGKAVK